MDDLSEEELGPSAPELAFGLLFSVAEVVIPNSNAGEERIFHLLINTF